jgi:hypothetical protein
MIFGSGFPYKLGQLSSSNKNSGKHKLSPSVQKNIVSFFLIVAYYYAIKHGEGEN